MLNKNISLADLLGSQYLFEILHTWGLLEIITMSPVQKNEYCYNLFGGQYLFGMLHTSPTMKTSKNVKSR